MFAYCNNNPVTYADPEGKLPSSIINPSAMALDSGSSLHPISDQERLQDQAKKLTNSSEEAVLAAEHYAFYKGALILKISGDDGFSYGIIFLGNNANDINLLKHEYGHFLHLCQIGFVNYTAKVLFPSLCDYWSDVPYSKYYSEPQEYIADVLGKTNRTYGGMAYPYEISNSEAILYYLFTMIP